MSIFTVSERWKTSFPGAVVGILVMHGVANPDYHPALDERKKELEERLRAQFSDGNVAALKTLPQIKAYDAYYRRFGKSYHVLLQVESIALKGKSIPNVAALVEAMFMAELKNLMLTAGHDLAAIELPVKLDVSTGEERYVRINGQEQRLKAGDMMMSDGRGVISNIIYGPDQRTRITSSTRDVMFAVYAPPGIEEVSVRNHLDDIRANVLLITPKAETELLQLHVAS